MIYSKPPLNFVGNKRNCLKYFRQALKLMENDGLITKDTIFYDIFGGSGLLSHTIKELYPYNDVVWNDYDDYLSRLKKVKECESLRLELLEIVKPFKYKEKLSEEKRLQIHELLKSKAYVDYTLISMYLCFSGKYCDEKSFFNQNVLYHIISREKIKYKGYLKGVLRVSMDFKSLMNLAYYGSKEELNKYTYLIDDLEKEEIATNATHSRNDGLVRNDSNLKSSLRSSTATEAIQHLSNNKITSATKLLRNDEKGWIDGREEIASVVSLPRNDAYNANAFLILDPPYLNTELFHYKGKKWDLNDFLYLMFFIKKPFITFGSAKSNIYEFMKFSDMYLNLKHLKEVEFLQYKALLKRLKDQREFMFFSKNKALF